MCLAAFLIIGPITGQTQPIGEHLDSIEWMSSDSSLIVRGAIINVVTEDDQENYALWHTVSFRVDETLKGKPVQKLTFIVQTNTGDKSIAQWKQDGRQLLAFLEESRCVVAAAGTYGAGRYARFEFAPRNGYSQNSFLELDASAESKAYDLTLRPTKSPEATILVVKKAVMAPPRPAGKLCSNWVSVPGRGELLRLAVPIDDRLEAPARGWIESDDKDFRVAGAGALIYFRSEANRHILQKLLSDAGVWNYVVDNGKQGDREVRVYAIREKAYSILKEWGYDVPPPVLREPPFP
jgi:hypothetical protein